MTAPVGRLEAQVPAGAWVVVLAGVAAALHLGKLPPAVPALQGALGITLVQAGFLLSLVQCAGMTLGLLAGLAADTIGSRRSMLIGLFVLTAASFTGGFVGSAEHAIHWLLVLRVLEGVYEITAKIIEMIMKFAPFAVACLLFNSTARFGLDLLQALGWFVVTVLLGLTLHMFGVYSLSIYFLSRISPLEFFRRIKTVILTAFSTSSSNATLPTALRVSEQNLGVPQEINSFVLTVGATANQNGTALYEGVTVLFLAQLAGIDLTLGQQVMVVYLAILGGVGTAGIPSGSIPFIIGVLVTIGINPALIAIILGVDRILDMCRTTLNVTGDLTAATFVARSEGYELLKPHEPAIVRAGVPMANRVAD